MEAEERRDEEYVRQADATTEKIAEEAKLSMSDKTTMTIK